MSGSPEAVNSRWTNMFDWAYVGVDHSLPGNGGQDCVDFIPFWQRVLESGLACVFSALAINYAYKRVKLPEKIPLIERSDRCGKRVLLVVMCMTFGIELGFKFATRQFIWICNPCHITSMIQIYLLAAPPSKMVTAMFRMHLHMLTGAPIAILFPVINTRLVKSSISRERSVVSPDIEPLSFFDSDFFTAVPLLSSNTSTSTTTSSAISWNFQQTAQTTPTISVTTCSATSSSTCQTVQSHCSLTWFADITLQSSAKSTNSSIHPQTLTTENSETSFPTVETSFPTVETSFPSEKTSACSMCDKSEKVSYSAQCQTPYNLVTRRSMSTQESAVMVDKATQTKRARLQLPRDHHDISLNDSLISLGSNTDTRDPEWRPSDEFSDTDSDSECEEDVNVAKERKFIVFESCLNELLEKCHTCGQKTVTDKRTVGTCLICTVTCLVCGDSRTWTSQPMSGTMPYGNLILSASIMFAGASPAKHLRILDFAGIQNISLKTYMTVQSAYLTPTIIDVWKKSQRVLVQEIKDNERRLQLAGDARCCSPGHIAKFGSYSLMDLHTGKILDLQLVQSNEVKNSYAMELEGLQRSLELLTVENNLTVSDLVTDRHSSIKKYMREQQPEIKHWFDVWHVAKGVYKKLEAAGKKKGCKKVKDWARSVSNHLYWCAASSNGDGELVQQKWLSILNHVTNVHQGHGDRFPRCIHDELEDREWMIRGFKPHSELEKIVKGRLLLTDVKKLSPTHQTSSLESFHNLVCSYTSKSVHYFHAQMEARLFLAAIHFNENCSRAQAVTKTGELQYSVSSPKSRKGEGIAKEVKVEQTFDYIDTLMDHLLQKRNANKSYSEARRARALEPARPPPLAQSTPVRPRKEDIIRSHVTRFNR